MNVEDVKALATAEATKAAEKLRQTYENTIADLQARLQSANERASKFENAYNEMRATIHGKGSQVRSTIAPEDLQEFRVARIQGASLEEVIETEAASRGLSADEYIKRSIQGQV